MRGSGKAWSGRRLCFQVCCALALLAGSRQAQALQFSVTYAPEVSAKPFTGRVLVMLSRAGGREPRFGPDWFQPEPFFAVDVKDWKPDTELVIGAAADGFPGPLKALSAGTYSVQAVMDWQLHSHTIGTAAGNGYSAAITEELDPTQDKVVSLRITNLVKPRGFQESERIKLVDLPSPLLTKFYGRPIRQRAAVILPEGYDRKPEKKYPTVYIIPGFGGDHHMANALIRFPVGPGEIPALRVVLDPDAPTGHHVFADSENNGPRGKALLTELIPYIEKTYRAVPKPYARFLNGHSSGGWSSLWLQVTYPDFFGGTWSTAPDPVDFRDFQQINLYTADVNMYRNAAGKERPLARFDGIPRLFFKSFSDMETVMGHGGQLQSFEAVFSPKGEDGKPKPLWDRETGAVDSSVAKAWEKYDISLILQRQWKQLAPKLRGKLHVITGSMDNFYLEGAARLLKERLTKLGSDAVIEIQPGKDHGTLLTQELKERIGREMMEAYAKGGK